MIAETLKEFGAVDYNIGKSIQANFHIKGKDVYVVFDGWTELNIREAIQDFVNNPPEWIIKRSPSL